LENEVYIDLFEIELRTKVYIELIEGPTIRRTSGLTDRQLEEQRNCILSGARKSGYATNATIERKVGFGLKRKPKIKLEETDLDHTRQDNSRERSSRLSFDDARKSTLSLWSLPRRIYERRCYNGTNFK